MIGTALSALADLYVFFDWLFGLFKSDSSSDSSSTIDETTSQDDINETFASNSESLDSDSDGFSDETEKLLGTNPFAADTDGDGGFDSEELLMGTDPLDAASYTKTSDLSSFYDMAYQVRQFDLRHGINGGEYELPDGQHSDADGVPDDIELLQQTDIEVADDYLDTDFDGLPDYYEQFVLGTDHENIDTDGDGDWDGDELDKGTDPTDATSFTDENGDGISDAYAARMEMIDNYLSQFTTSEASTSLEEAEDTNTSSADDVDSFIDTNGALIETLDSVTQTKIIEILVMESSDAAYAQLQAAIAEGPSEFDAIDESEDYDIYDELV